jgi:LacI family transcriptional regulator
LTTINDVAKRAGVSPVTVSRVINGVPNVNAATRERVLRVVSEVGYVPNTVARSLRSKRTNSLALLVPDITNSFWTTIARGVEDAAQTHGYTVLLCNTDESPTKQASYLEVVASQRVDGIIIAPSASGIDQLSTLRDRDIPTVVLDRRVEGWGVDWVIGDSVGGAYALVKHLVGLSHTRIGIISGPRETSTADDRLAGACLALEDAGIPPDPDLIRRGEFRSASGEALALQLLALDPRPTAVFAANNAIALGVVDAVAALGLRIPQDVALVCFDDLAFAGRLFPFLTVAYQPAYEMGLNAAQLLLSRLDAEVALKPRQVMLPCRLVVRYSCGARLAASNGLGVSLPIAGLVPGEDTLIRPLPLETQARAARLVNQGAARLTTHPTDDAPHALRKPDVTRLLRVIGHQEADRVPHLEFWVTSKAVYEYVLERELQYEVADARLGTQSVVPEDDVEFAQRIGMDAVTCHFPWRPGNRFRVASDGNLRYAGGTVRTWDDLESLEPPPSPAVQLNRLEQYLRAAQGTGVGVIANFTSFFDSALLAIGVEEGLAMLVDNRRFVESLMDRLVAAQARVVRAVCDRFGNDLAMVLINDDVAFRTGLLVRPSLFRELFYERMQRLIAPVKEHGLPLAFHSDGRLGGVLPVLYELGFDAVHPIEPESNDIAALRDQWRGRLALIGNVPTTLLAFGSEEEVTAAVRDACIRLGPGGGWVLASSNSIMQGIPPQRFVAMVQAVHRYGSYAALGVAF